ncbi:hypothetical protein [Flavobacterium panici]|uniref:Uncharacterized protein n=1 Tax=Flavobacterium panici TaxID=2654843 RepID=A0A9N8J279_9FLAO|nr:hypothetical protein [Flavobacterium panici]CAC9974737.1 hypothetical protein FLAPXU55_02434 [Flavobacterium panici]
MKSLLTLFSYFAKYSSIEIDQLLSHQYILNQETNEKFKENKSG